MKRYPSQPIPYIPLSSIYRSPIFLELESSLLSMIDNVRGYPVSIATSSIFGSEHSFLRPLRGAYLPAQPSRMSPSLVTRIRPRMACASLRTPGVIPRRQQHCCAHAVQKRCHLTPRGLASEHVSPTAFVASLPRIRILNIREWDHLSWSLAFCAPSEDSRSFSLEHW
ncbi:hypothetical protein EI94DRAFT_1105112 [Lactarius quietus]|nr:hypothetical protein EI94DRAFT_1105112 [Lactarius quietus]